jgi:metallophosphoesterase superfamily enzyme
LLILDNSYKITIFDEELTLLPFKSIYFELHKTLLVSDINLGKVGHFKNSPVSISGGLAETDLVLLDKIFKELEVNELFILGDLFHKGVNYDIRLFNAWRDVHQSVDINLIKGSSEIMSDEIYSNFDIRLHKKYYLWNRFLFTHKPMDENIQLNGCDYIFSGYINSGINLAAKNKPPKNLACYYFNEKQCILPAFGESTRKSLIKPDINDRVYVIAEEKNEPVVLKYAKK